MKTMKECEICYLVSSKYTCPLCRKRYCSLNCYKNHNESGICVNEDETKRSVDYIKEIKFEGKIQSLLDYGDDSEDYVPKKKLKLLGESDRLKEILHNPHVRSILKDLDTARNPGGYLTKLMHEPIFLEFANECLHIVDNSSELSTE